MTGRGFTLVELLVVLLLLALATGGTVLALRDGEADRVEREGVRLAALLDAARAEARASAAPVRFRLASAIDGAAAAPVGFEAERRPADFHFDGLPPGAELPTHWQEPGIRAEFDGHLQLGPEPLIPAQRIVLHLDHWQVTIHTDGLGPFEVDPPVEANAR